MFLIFKKEFREIEKIRLVLSEKAQKSKKFEKNNLFDGMVWEEYGLDTINVLFTVENYTLMAKDKDGKTILNLDCSYDVDDKIQRVKCHMFSSLLQKYRTIYDKISAKEQLDKTKESLEKIEFAKRQSKEAEKKRIQTLIQANNILRNI